MRISHRFTFLFYHVPKTGGSSIEAAISRISSRTSFATKHTTFEESRKVYKKYFDYRKFAFVRNPWSLLFSWFTAANRTQQHLITKENFKEFVSKVPNLPLVPNTQFSYLCEGDTLAMDYVGKFETLDRDFKDITEKIGMPKFVLPHENGSNKGRYDYRDFYTEESIDFVRDHFRVDVEVFGYDYKIV
jgi:hypothetical protein